MQKRGISNVVVAIILVLLVILAIAIIWLVIRGLLRDNVELGDAKMKILDQKININNISGNIKDLSSVDLTLVRGPSKIVLVNVTTKETIVNADIVLVMDLSGSMRLYDNCHDADGENIYLSSVINPDCTTNPASCNCMQKHFWNDCGGTQLLGLKAPFQNCKSNRLNEFCSDCFPTEFKSSEISKISQAKAASSQFVKQVLDSGDSKSRGKRIGLVGFDSNAENWVSGGVITRNMTFPLSNQSANMTEFINNSWYAFGSTCICCGINKAIDLLSTSTAEYKTIIVLTDGQETDTCGSLTGEKGTIISAKKAKSLGIKVYTIGFGTTGIDFDTLREAAKQGNGEFYQANTGQLAETFTKVYKETINTYIAEKVDHLNVVFYNASMSQVEIITDPPQVAYESRTYSLKLTPPISNVQKIEVYSVVITPSGKEVVGDTPLAVWTFH